MANNETPVWTEKVRARLAKLYDAGELSVGEIHTQLCKEFETKFNRKGMVATIKALREEGVITTYHRVPKHAKPGKGKGKGKGKVAARRTKHVKWDDAESMYAWEVSQNAKSMKDVAAAVNDKFKRGRHPETVRRHLKELQKVIRKREKAAARAKNGNGNGASKGAALVLSAKAAVEISPRTPGKHVQIPEGRAVTVEYPEGQIRLLVHGKVPLETINVLSRNIADSICAGAIVDA